MSWPCCIGVVLFAVEASAFESSIQSILQKTCLNCHSTEKQKGDLDLERFTSVDDIKKEPMIWLEVLEQVKSGEMPPKKEPQLSAEQKNALLTWTQTTLDDIALASAGDPGPVVLRRLSNMEYTYTVRDLTSVESLDPAKEFPVDGAAGEGFTNVGSALVMSPALLTKYLDAAKEIASHAVFTPHGMHFSAGDSSRDWTDETLAKIRAFYAGFTESSSGTAVNLQGIKFDTNAGGRLPVARYLAALQSKGAIEGLNAKYLAMLRAAFTETKPSLLLDGLRKKFRVGKLTASDIESWQQSLWRFASVGHIGKENGPKSWQEPVTPLVAQHEMRLKLTAPADGSDVTLYLATSDAGDGSEHDEAVWQNARLIAPGRADLYLKDVPAVLQQLEKHRESVITSVMKCLAAAHEAQNATERTDIAKLAQKHGVESAVLAGWLDYLGIGSSGSATLGPLLTKQMNSTPDYRFIQGWTGENALSVLANSSAATVRTPGTMKAHSVATHPSPTMASVIAWRSPVGTALRIMGSVQDAHPECGNGVTWALELRRGNTREVLASGDTKGGTLFDMGKHENIRVLPGDAIALVIGPKEGNHVCDLTAVDLVLSDGKQEWSLAKDVSPNILAGNPHADSLGNKDVWYFFGEPASAEVAPKIPSGSLLALWRKTADGSERERLASQVQQLLTRGLATVKKDSSNRALHEQLLSFNGPLLGAALKSVVVQPGSSDIEVKAPSVLEFRVPASMADGAEFVVTGKLQSSEGSVQMQVLTTKPTQLSGITASKTETAVASGQWSDNNLRTMHSAPIIVNDGSAARRRLEAAFDDFRALFPIALCYSKIVPVDEVVTLTLFHREDDHLKRLMLDDTQSKALDQLWDELRFVSESPLKQVDVFEQLFQFATQDAKPSAFEPMREPITRAAETFKKQLVDVEPMQVQAALDFATQAWRRPLSAAELSDLRTLYQKLRKQELPHVTAMRMLIARVLVAPAFLYRGEKAAPGPKAAPVSETEFATRLSYFLWSSAPDEELRSAAVSGKLHDSLAAQAKRMMKSDKIRRLATEFGCQWLHVRDVATLDEKSERHFPTFLGLRSDMQEEVTRFIIDLIQNNRSVLSLLDADHTFVTAELAKHYGIDFPADSKRSADSIHKRPSPNLLASLNLWENQNWSQVSGMKEKGRGGILGFAATLAKQSGASRNSAILRGTWLSEVILGDKLPVPPKGVPVLPEEPPANLTERQLIERHSRDENCMGCHKRIDPFGFALEGFDAIGRSRQADTKTILPDGTAVDGLADLRNYLLTKRHDDFLRQFSRKLLGYALGRSVQLSDKPLIETMVKSDLRIGTLVDLIVRSPQFREVRGRNHRMD